MLGKLIKNEIRHSARYTMTIYIAVAALVGVMGLALITKTTWIGLMGCLALYVTGIAVVMVTLVSVIKNFYDTLYGRQGYLTFTLPVKCSTLLISKVIVSFMWIIVSFAVMIGTYLLIFLYARQRTEGTFDLLGDAIAISGILEMLPSGIVIAEFLAVMGILAVITILTYVGYVYFTVTVANTRALQAHPKFYGGAVFFLLFLIVNIISTKLTELIPLTFNVTTEKVYFAFQNMSMAENVILSYGIGGTIFSGIVAVALLFATGYIMEHKVNLK